MNLKKIEDEMIKKFIFQILEASYDVLLSQGYRKNYTYFIEEVLDNLRSKENGKIDLI